MTATWEIWNWRLGSRPEAPAARGLVLAWHCTGENLQSTSGMWKWRINAGHGVMFANHRVDTSLMAERDVLRQRFRRPLFAKSQIINHKIRFLFRLGVA
jgi:hypothetical protein